jgi:PIN domain nuclease of toxin-antitoxin system
MILLDTHALIWWFDNDPRLSASAKQAIDIEQYSGLSGYHPCRAGRLHCWYRAERSICPTKSVHGGLNNDPADRIIVATAMLLNVPIVTRDGHIQAYPHVRTIW